MTPWDANALSKLPKYRIGLAALENRLPFVSIDFKEEQKKNGFGFAQILFNLQMCSKPSFTLEVSQMLFEWRLSNGSN